MVRTQCFLFTLSPFSPFGPTDPPVPLSPYDGKQQNNKKYIFQLENHLEITQAIHS